VLQRLQAKKREREQLGKPPGQAQGEGGA